MAYEPGGGSGEPYSRYEDLNYDPRYSIQDWISNVMRQGNVGVAPPMGTNMPDFAQDSMYGRTSPSDLRPDDFIREMLDRQQQLNPDGEPGNENRDEEYQVAGDVLPMRTHPPSVSDVNMRLQTPGVGARSQGMQSIRNFGGPSMGSPYLDLMDVLMGRFPGPGGR
jgi:hypothetical protein